jgi:protein-L-isoaspartate O-methyltransferase
MFFIFIDFVVVLVGLSFLNVGSGTGYFNCLVGYIIKRNSVNHGIEQHDDLVEFSRERCEEFMRFSPMMSREMSPPVFLAGNCFRLDTRDIQYDRIYCGAACPHSKLPFILSMTKVRGFAIIPCKNKVC